MSTNHDFLAKELPLEEMETLYKLLGKNPPKKDRQSRFRLRFRFSKKTV